jgi:predicted DCC family thiol-disulfide oxidoreductase YuxK
MLTVQSNGCSDAIMAILIVWFDGSCPLCAREIALMRWLDRRGAITFQDVSPPDAICPLDRQTLLARFHASVNGVLLSGAEAFAAMWRAVPILWPLGQAARIPIIARALERAYLAFLKVRPTLQASLK